ncbi:hypothetical protein TCAL_00841 [Tigriopus californicus]|uniref:Uncharacterized protein n=2 Tax=Tigriopus californicus TaxID=6832 RepID=A0A553NFB6_TIGCA|nr:hypothetical protein TCAL_00841 [Tigriopus californicus]
MQMFKKPVNIASQGDRVGICVSQFDAKLLERGLVSAPGFVPWIWGAIIDLQTIPYFKGEINSKAKFHISLGHETVLAKITLFQGMGANAEEFSYEREFLYRENLLEEGDGEAIISKQSVFALLEFDKALPVVPECKVLGSKLDINSNSPTCRLAFHGQLLEMFEAKDYHLKELPRLKIFKEKSKTGVVERASNECEAICKNMFKKETNLALFTGLKVNLSTGESGFIEDSFGQSGKFKVRIPDGLQPTTMDLLGTKTSKKSKKAEDSSSAATEFKSVGLFLNFKKYIFSKKMAQ